MFTFKKIFGIIAFTSMFYSYSAISAEYYVSPTGTATWAQCQNINTPCSGRTAVTNAQAGDIVYFRGGTYDPASDPVAEWTSTPNSLKYETLPWNPQNSGQQNNPITFKAYPNETPIILDNIYSGAFGAAHRSWIVWDGFTSTIVDSLNDVLQLVVFEFASNCVLKNSHLIGVRKATHHNAGLVFLNYSSDILIENNRIHGMNSYEPTDPEYIEVANNASGVFNFYSYNLTVKNNDIYDNYYGIWDKDTEQNNRYFNNHIWGTNGASTGCNTGIQINDQRNEFGVTSGTKVHNNLVRNCDNAIVIYDGVGTNYGVEIFNNTIVDTDLNNETGIFVTNSSIGASIYNNIIYGYSVLVRYYTPVSTRVAYSDHNTFYAPVSTRWNVGFSTGYTSLSSWNSVTALDANSRTMDPDFQSPVGSNPNGYRLSATSQAIGAGRNGDDLGAFPSNSPTTLGYQQIRPMSPVLSVNR